MAVCSRSYLRLKQLSLTVAENSVPQNYQDLLKQHLNFDFTVCVSEL